MAALEQALKRHTFYALLRRWPRRYDTATPAQFQELEQLKVGAPQPDDDRGESLLNEVRQLGHYSKESTANPSESELQGGGTTQLGGAKEGTVACDDVAAPNCDQQRKKEKPHWKVIKGILKNADQALGAKTKRSLGWQLVRLNAIRLHEKRLQEMTRHQAQPADEIVADGDSEDTLQMPGEVSSDESSSPYVMVQRGQVDFWSTFGIDGAD